MSYCNVSFTGRFTEKVIKHDPKDSFISLILIRLNLKSISEKAVEGLEKIEWLNENYKHQQHSAYYPQVNPKWSFIQFFISNIWNTLLV